VHHSIVFFYHQLDAHLLYSVIYVLQNKANMHQVGDQNKFNVSLIAQVQVALKFSAVS
jgi:hypothetical protein